MTDPTPPPPELPKPEPLEICWRAESVQEPPRILLCGIYQVGSQLEVRLGYDVDDVLDSWPALSVDVARAQASAWKRLVMQQGGFRELADIQDVSETTMRRDRFNP